MAITDISLPAVEPISLDYAKTYLRVDHSDSDDVIEGFVRAARAHIEDRLRTVLMERGRRLISFDLSSLCIRIDDYPVKSLSAVTLNGAAGERLDVPLADVQLQISSQPAQLSLSRAAPWDMLLSNAVSIEVEYLAGYGSSVEDVPLPLRQAVLLMTGYFYQYRGDADAPPYPLMLDALLMPYHRVRL